MKHLFLAFISIICLSGVSETMAQKKNWTKLDKSPMDVVYFPTALPVKTTFKKSKENPLIKIYYSRPQLDGRTMLGSKKVPYEKIWRLGANEATEITFYQNVIIAGKEVKAGTYSVYSIPYTDKWTMIVNKKLNTWGNYKYEKEKDIARFDVHVKATDEKIEALSMALIEDDENAKWIIGWEDALVEIPIKFNAVK